MSFFKNKHVITAMIVSPLLAVLTYFAVDSMVKEVPHAAIAGQSYPLLAKSNCRFSSGACDLENASFRIRMQISTDSKRLELSSSHALQRATIGFVEPGGLELAPVLLNASTKDAKAWSISLPDSVNSESIARLAVHASDALYFAETSMRFGEYETTFKKDFRK